VEGTAAETTIAGLLGDQAAELLTTQIALEEHRNNALKAETRGPLGLVIEVETLTTLITMVVRGAEERVKKVEIMEIIQDITEEREDTTAISFRNLMEKVVGLQVEVVDLEGQLLLLSPQPVVAQEEEAWEALEVGEKDLVRLVKQTLVAVEVGLQVPEVLADQELS